MRIEKLGTVEASAVSDLNWENLLQSGETIRIVTYSIDKYLGQRVLNGKCELIGDRGYRDKFIPFYRSLAEICSVYIHPGVHTKFSLLPNRGVVVIGSSNFCTNHSSDENRKTQRDLILESPTVYEHFENDFENLKSQSLQLLSQQQINDKVNELTEAFLETADDWTCRQGGLIKTTSQQVLEIVYRQNEIISKLFDGNEIQSRVFRNLREITKGRDLSNATL